MKVEFFKHNIGRRELADLKRTLGGLFLTTGKEVELFENELAGFLALPHAVGVTSCTAAIQLALTGLGVGPGDEVITTPLSFAATALAVIQAGATPVFADVEAGSGNLDPGQAELAITGRTRAILPVHLGGLLCDMKTLRSLADKHGLALVEDAAHALEAERDGVRVGELGDAACFSFYPTKSITSGEGGAVATRHPELDKSLRLLRHHGMDCPAEKRYGKDDVSYRIVTMGWKYNMSNIQAVLLRGQLERAWKMHGRRARLAARYRRKLKNVPGVVLPPVHPEARHAHHLFTISVPAGCRRAFLGGMAERGVGVSVNYSPPIHLHPFFRDKYGFSQGDFPVAESISRTTVSLPLYPKLTNAEVDYVAGCVAELRR
ncbi:MAG: DegT/DnrJ/EryC1/StrS family aminotransferase [Candidatus Glassbacteria bacterium]|nr:DegT/DnrJ/EryC1/StrS family aminotransferase [Candidatus Glassbacteria bacterium]